jgi:2,4'-dihydroxyacetophenone dioxygenase
MLHTQIDTAVIDHEALPWMPFAPYSNEVMIKYFKADPIRGEVIAMLKVPANTTMARHHHSGTVVVYTLQGSWKYVEHDWVAGPGSLVYETAASTHTPQALPDGGDVIALNIVVGDLIYMDEAGNVIAMENWKTALARYLAYCKDNNLEVVDITAFK